jgi:hypothetical protein
MPSYMQKMAEFCEFQSQNLKEKKLMTNKNTDKLKLEFMPGCFIV